MTHKLKTVNPYFTDMWRGVKTFEIRKNDRHFTRYECLLLQEYDITTKTYSGREILCEICYITDYEQKPGFVVLGLRGLTNMVTEVNNGPSIHTSNARKVN